MPRIDPVQLLKCLSVLLDTNGGIKSQDEVQRLASLMTKFSKKLVSKCIYIHILKQTKTDLLGLFMGAGGWTLTHVWLTEGILAKNGALVKELLELLLVCPVDVDRLKSNNCPKLVKDLSKDGSIEVVRTLASKLVEQWLKIVKGETTSPLTLSQVTEILSPTENIVEVLELSVSEDQKDEKGTEDVDQSRVGINGDAEGGAFEFISVNEESDINDISNVDVSAKTIEAIPILKISVKDGKQVVSKVSEPVCEKKTNENDKIPSDKISENKKDDRTITKDRNRDKDRSSSKSNSSKSSSSKYSKSSSDNSKESNNSSSSKVRDSSRSKSSKSSSSKDSKHTEKYKDKDSESNKVKDIIKQKYSDKHKDKNVDKSKDREADKHKTSNKNKDAEKHDRHKSSLDKHKEKDAKIKEQSEKNKETLQKLQPVPLTKLGKIPKKTPTDEAKLELKKDKPSISIEVRKPNDSNRPKTVKMFNSKFRSHGLEEEAKRPPPRGMMVKKVTAPLTPPVILPPPKQPSSPPKRPSSPPTIEIPPEKKMKVTEHVDKPGAIKLIPPKPKPAYLLESDMFMDALAKSATNKKEPKKRKRRISGSKDGASAGDSSPPTTPTTPTDINENGKPNSSSEPPRFYQDTLETEEDNKQNNSAPEVKEEKSPEIEEIKKEIPAIDKDESVVSEIQSPDHPMEVISPGLKGVLLYHKRMGPKKTLRWRPEGELEEIQYFELDENERVNVTKTFNDLMHLDRVQERENFRKCRNLLNEDVMEEKMAWRPLVIVDSDATYVEYGKHSKEKDIQTAREKSILPALYFHKSVIPESPFEPDAENHPTTDPVIMPLEDVTGNPDSINDYRNTPWPEPKLIQQPIPSGMPMPPIFPNMPQFPPGFPPNPPFGVPGFPPNPAMLAGEWPNGPPGLMMPPEAMNMGPDMFSGNVPMFPGPMPPNGFGMMDNMNGPMFHPRFSAPVQGVPVMPMPGIPNGPNGPFNVMNNNNSNNRGNIRNMGPRHQNSHWRQKGPGSWNGPPRGGGSRARLCTYFQKSGFCRQGDNCHFVHSGVSNGPY